MHQNRGQILSKVKIELLEVYALQMEGKITLDNKQINELSTSGTSEDLTELSEMEDDEHQRMLELVMNQNDDSGEFDYKQSSTAKKEIKNYSKQNFIRRKTLDEEIQEVLCQQSDESVVLKYTKTQLVDSKPPVDKLKDINKIRPVTLAMQSEIKPLKSFHEEAVVAKIEKMLEKEQTRQNLRDFKFEVEPLIGDGNEPNDGVVTQNKKKKIQQKFKSLKSKNTT